MNVISKTNAWAKLTSPYKIFLLSTEMYVAIDFLKLVKYYNDYHSSQRSKVLAINSEKSNLYNFSYLNSYFL